MSDLAAIVKSVANDMVRAGEKAGEAFIKHLRDIGGELRASSGLYRDTENGIKGRIGEIGHDVSGDAAHDAGSLARDADGAGGPGSLLHDGSGLSSDGKSLTSEEEKALAAREKGADGATDDPVDVVTGEMFLPQEDLALPGVLPLVLGRRHGSAYTHGELFGTRWASTLDQHAVTGFHEIRVALEDGRVLHYPVPGDGERVMPSHGPRWPLAWDRQSDAVTVEQGDLGQTLHFAARAAAGPRRRLLAVTDRAGNEITFTYGDDGVINGVRHSGGYHVKVGTRVTLGGVRVSSLALADPDGGDDIMVREFRYSLAGHLTGVVNASGLPLLFEYDSEGRITRWEDRNGYEYRYTYREDGRVVRGEGTGGFLNVTLDYDLDERTTTVTDALGHETVHHWNDRFQVVRVVDPLGHETRTEKDEYGNVLSVTDALGHITRIDRNEFGDPVLITRPDGSTTAVSYNDDRQPVSVVDSAEREWKYEYGPHGQMASATDPAGSVMRYERDEFGRVTAVIDPLGAVTRMRSDGAGLPAEVSDPLGARTVYRRDAFGLPVEITNPLGAATRFTWNADGNPLSLIHPDGTAESWTYDAEGNVVEYADAAGQVTRYQHGPFDLPVQRTEPDGAAYQFAYTPHLQLESVNSALGQSWLYEYDPAGRLIAETDFNGVRQSYELDAAGRVTGRVNAAGQRTSYARDPLGRLTERASGDGISRFTYGPDGLLARAESPGVLLEYTRDPAGRILAEAVNGRTIANRYDLAGRRTSRVTPSGMESEWTYDAAGRAARLRAGNDILEFGYDRAGNESGRRLGPFAELTQAYDVAGRLAEQGIWSLDQTGARRSSIQARTYTYGEHSLPVEIGDRLRGTRRFGLDSAGRITQVQAEGWREEYAYDALGNITAAQDDRLSGADANADIAGPRVIEGTLLRSAGRTRYEYDESGRLVRQTRRTLSGQVRSWTYEWNADDRLVSVSTPSNGTWRYVYDALGRRVSKQQITANGDTVEETWFTWDDFRIAEQEQVVVGGQVAVLTWDYQGTGFTPVTQIQRTLASSDDSNDQAEVDQQFYAIVADLVGTPQELVTPDGKIAWRTITSLWGQSVTAPGAETDCPLRFPGQYYDEETGLHYNNQRYYDPATGIYLTPDPLGLIPSPNPYSYVPNPQADYDPIGLSPYRYPVDLQASEANGGHAIERHVGKDDAYLRNRNIPNASTYKDLPAATKETQANVNAHESDVTSWLAGNGPQKKITNPITDPSNARVLSRATGGEVPGRTVVTILRRDPRMPQGFRVHTSYVDP